MLGWEDWAVHGVGAGGAEQLCENKIRGAHYKGIQYAEADTCVDIHSCLLIGPQTTNKRPRGWGTSTEGSGMFFLLRDSV